jgi:hypothetical protein
VADPLCFDDHIEGDTQGANDISHEDVEYNISCTRSFTDLSHYWQPPRQSIPVMRVTKPPTLLSQINKSTVAQKPSNAPAQNLTMNDSRYFFDDLR